MEERALEEQAVDGLSEEALSSVLQRMERAVRGMCPTWMADRRDDLVQVAVMRVMEISRKGEKSRNFNASYLWRAAHSAMIDEIRRMRRRNEVELEESSASDDPQWVSDRASPERRAESRYLASELQDCLRGLAGSRKQAVTLHLQGYSPAESAPLLGWATKKVYNLVHRGLQDLRDCLDGKGIRP